MITLRSLCIAIALASVAQAQQPSGTPQCTTSCPPQDEASFPVGSGSSYTSDSGGVLFCSYPAFPGENPDDFYCTYNDSTGSLITDNDAGFCPPAAIVSCVNSRRFKGDDNYTAMLRKKGEAAAMMPRSSEPRQLLSDPFKLKARKPSASIRSEEAE
ncbi:hypothetical protein MSAN_01780400 [Mycena sanguinolenta]|uniref:Uncharacterized protein n=1 Tax=Mycena sanguinolenta TaxID=230812 RepID=A0A8H7CUW1_9AGAR|nr:hypothetical protein MSAN_01780400 [Mycena sanguinolenta]